MDDLRALRCFVAVADELHFGRAARVLVLPQSTVSQQVKRLEREIGAPLFERTTRRVNLTNVGAEMLDDARIALRAVDALVTTARSSVRTRRRPVTIGLAMDIDSGELSIALQRFRRRHPDLHVELRAMRTSEQLTAIEQAELDLGYVWEPPSESHLVTYVIGTTGLIAFVPDDHPLAGDSTATMAHLATFPIVAWSASLNPWTRRRLTSAFNEQHLEPLIVDEADGYDSQLPLVLEGRGVGVTAASIADLRTIPGITHIPITDPVLFHRCIVHHRSNDNPAVGALLDLLPVATR